MQEQGAGIEQSFYRKEISKDDYKFFVDKAKIKCSHLKDGLICDKHYKKALISLMSKLHGTGERQLFFIKHLYSHPSCYFNRGLEWLYHLKEYILIHDKQDAYGTDVHLEGYEKEEFLELLKIHIHEYLAIMDKPFSEKRTYLLEKLMKLPKSCFYDISGILGSENFDESVEMAQHLYKYHHIDLLEENSSVVMLKNMA